MSAAFDLSPAPPATRTWNVWDLDQEERETILFLRRLMRARNVDCLMWSWINEEINKLRQEIDVQRQLYQEWQARRWWQVSEWFHDPPVNPDAHPLPLVATDDGWMAFMVAIERLRLKGIIWEKPLLGGGYERMYKLRN